MKLYPNQLAKHLKTNLSPLYLISGDEPLLVQEARDEILTAARKKGFSGHEYHQVNKDFKWQSLYAASHSLSLFDERSIIELRWQSAKPGTTGAAALVDYCQNPSPDKLLLIIAPKIDSATTRSKWYKALDALGVSIPIWPIERAYMPKWVAERMTQSNISTDATGIKIIIDATEGNLLACAQEIEKLRLLFGEGRLSAEQIVSAIADNARFDVFSLIDTIHLAKGAPTLRVLARLRQEGCEPTLMLWALTRELRTLANVHTAVQNGESSALALKKNGVWDKRQPAFKQSLNRLSLSRIYNLLELAGNIDRSIKGLTKSSVWDDLTTLCIEMTVGNTKELY